MVERLLSKPEVRGAIPRISEVKDIEQLINFFQKTTLLKSYTGNTFQEEF